jgi:hypothetical protein
MLRRRFLQGSILLPSVISSLLNRQNTELSKILDSVRQGEKFDTVLGGDKYTGFELRLKDKSGAYRYMLYALDYYLKRNDLDGNKSCFVITSYEKKHLLFDFGMDENVDIYIDNTIINLDNVFTSLEDAMVAYKNKDSKNRNLRMINSKDDEINKLFKNDLKEISSLLNI